MINFIKIVLLLILTMTVAGLRGNDTLRVNSFKSFQINNTQNIWHSTENMTGLIYNLPNKMTDFNSAWISGNGDYHRIMEGSGTRHLLFSTNSYQKINKFYLAGSFAYHNTNEDGGRWNGTYDPYRGNPYILGDSVQGVNYHRENYRLAGGVATSLSERISLGFGVDYFVGVGAKQKDPRPKNNVVEIKFNPGIIFHTEQYNIGLNAGYQNRKEEISYQQTISDNPDISYYAFKSFGFFTKEIDSNYIRYQNQQSILGGVQFETKKTKLPTLTEIKFNLGTEKIDDGSSAPQKDRGGDWDVLNLHLKEILHYGAVEKLHKFELNGNYFDGNGTEYTQEKVYNGNVVEYVTIAKNLKFNRKIVQAQLGYSFQKLNPENQLDRMVVSSLSFVSNQENYYFIPEIFTSSYSNIIGAASFEKNLYLKTFHFAPKLSASYTYNIANDLLLSDLSEITKNQIKDIYIHDFNYQSSNLLKVEAQLELGWSAKTSKVLDQYFIHLNFTHYNPTDKGFNYSILTAKIGLMF